MSDPTGYRDSPNTSGPNTSDPNSGDNLVDGTPGNDPADRGQRDTTLTTDDDAQDEDSIARPGNAGS